MGSSLVLRPSSLDSLGEFRRNRADLTPPPDTGVIDCQILATLFGVSSNPGVSNIEVSGRCAYLWGSAA